jgi:hypothetical protein
MPMYLSRFSYTPEAWARLAKSPEDRSKAGRSYIESVGGKLHGFLTKSETTVLLTVEEILEALGRVEGIGYRPPGA